MYSGTPKVNADLQFETCGIINKKWIHFETFIYRKIQNLPELKYRCETFTEVFTYINVFQPFHAWCPLKGHTYLSKFLFKYLWYCGGYQPWIDQVYRMWINQVYFMYVVCFAIWYYLCNLKNMKNTIGGVLLLLMEGCYFTKVAGSGTLLKVTLLHGCFSHF